MPRAKKAEQLDLSEDVAGPLAKIGDENSELDTAFDTAIEQAREELHRIDERAEFAISVVTQAIRTQATVAKGRVLLQLRERFDQAPHLEGKWSQFLTSENLKVSTVNSWIQSAKLIADNAEQYGEDFLLKFGGSNLTRIQQMPTVIREAVLETAYETGEVPTQQEIHDIRQKPATKLAKALEELEANALKQKDVEENGENYRNHSKALEAQEQKLNETIEQLKSQIAEDKIKREQQEKEAERLNAELDLLKYDDAAAREQRIKRVASSLIVSLPAVLSDVQKYVAEKDHYESKHVKSIDSSIDTLINFLKPLYA